MRIISIAGLICLLTLTLAGCKSSDSPAAGQAASTAESPNQSQEASTGDPSSASSPVALKSKIDPCRVLTSDELKAVQGEPLQTTSPSERESTDFIVAQCYYQLPTIINSVVVNITTAKQGGKSPREFWRRMVLESESKREKPERKEKESRPEKISGVGEDAYWEASGVAGALYVLKKDVIFRISVGGASDIKTKLDNSKTLAKNALARL